MQNIQKAALAEWLLASIPADREFCFVTLTMKQAVNLDNTWIPINRQSADQNIAFFLKNLNRSIFKHAYERRGKRLIVIDASEGDGKNKRFHRHLLIEKPSKLTDEQFTSAIHCAWSKCFFSYRVVDVQRAQNKSAIVKYVTKESDSICLDNLSL